jgi:tetratricopeptide (TPR) repeat protein
MAFMAKDRANENYNVATKILMNNSLSPSKQELVKAINKLQKAVELVPDFAYAYHNLGYAWYMLAEYEYKESQIKRKYKTFHDVEISIKRAVEIGDDKKIKDIQEQYAKEVTEFAGNIEAYLLFALEEVDKALAIQNYFPQAHNTRSMILAKQGRLNEAIEEVDIAIRQNPDYKKADDNRKKFIELLKTG